MAFPDWPLSHGSLNPQGWWTRAFELLEHGHRMMAETVGLFVGILCAWVWRSRWGIPAAAGVSIILAGGAYFAGCSQSTVAHVGLWSSAVVFVGMILWRAYSGSHSHRAIIRWLALAAFAGVIGQAILGGLRVTIESGGDPRMATNFKILHGCFAQFELCVLVAIATLLSPSSIGMPRIEGIAKVSQMTWITATFVYIQLMVGATVRHLGAGLAIPSFPAATPDGAFLPVARNLFVDLNFTHTRIGACLIAVLVVCLFLRAVGNAQGEARILRPAFLLLGLVAMQITLGVLVIWNLRPPMLTTLHVLNGAFVLATAVWLGVRTSGQVVGRESVESGTGNKLIGEVTS